MQHAGASILVVDDEDGLRELFKERLEARGYVCHTAPNGYAALKVLAAEPIDLALVDIMMPGMTGLTLFQHVRERYADVAVILLTAVDDTDIAVKHLTHGAYDYIVKPVTRERLRQAVEGALDKRRAMVEGQQRLRLLEEQTARQGRELKAKTREISALNRASQFDLSKRLIQEEKAP